VERTVPLSFCVYSLVIVWYTLHGYHPDDLAHRRSDQPGTPTKTNPPSKTCSPSSAEHLSQHELQALPRLNPTPQIPRLRTGLRRCRRITAKLKKLKNPLKRGSCDTSVGVCRFEVGARRCAEASPPAVRRSIVFAIVRHLG
jgi:hypothetical protein